MTQVAKQPWLKWIIILLLTSLLSAFIGLRWSQQRQSNIDTLTSAGVVQRIQQLHHLQTVGYHIDTIVTSTKEGSWNMLWQDRQKGLFLVSGQVVAGIDLSKLTPQQVKVSAEGKQIDIQLPAAEILSNSLDKIEVYDIETGVFGLVDIDPKLFSAAQAAGKQKILSSACQSGILKTASESAKKQVTALFALAHVQVNVSTAPVPRCQ